METCKVEYRKVCRKVENNWVCKVDTVRIHL
jgi:hypothetical protein